MAQQTQARSAPARQRSGWLRRSQMIDAYLMLLPTIIGVSVFFAAPLLISFYLSFTNETLFAPGEFIGLRNYIEALKDPEFHLALRNTIALALSTLLLSVPPALGLAVLLNTRIKGRTFFRGLFFVPVVASVVGVSLVWRYLFNVDFGYINYGLRLLGLESVAWLTNPDTALISVILVIAWRSIGYNLVIFLAGLQGIPAQLYEAASIDGASRWQQFWHITVPMLSPTSFFILVTTLINILQVFGEPYALGVTRNGSAGPADSMLTIVFYLYRKGFNLFQMGYASAVAWILCAMIMLITIVQFRVSKHWVHYE